MNCVSIRSNTTPEMVDKSTQVDINETMVNSSATTPIINTKSTQLVKAPCYTDQSHATDALIASITVKHLTNPSYSAGTEQLLGDSNKLGEALNRMHSFNNMEFHPIYEFPRPASAASTGYPQPAILPAHAHSFNVGLYPSRMENPPKKRITSKHIGFFDDF